VAGQPELVQQLVDPGPHSDIAVTLTGILLAGAGYFWREVLGMFGGCTASTPMRPS